MSGDTFLYHLRVSLLEFKPNYKFDNHSNCGWSVRERECEPQGEMKPRLTRIERWMKLDADTFKIRP